MDYTEILGVKAKSMMGQLAREAKNPAYEDERLVECIHGAFCIIRNDTRAQMVQELLMGTGVTLTGFATQADAENAMRFVRNYVIAYAQQNQIPLPVVKGKI